LDAIQLADVVEGVDGGREAAVQAKDLRKEGRGRRREGGGKGEGGLSEVAPSI
jgi:hypothetical protein